LEKNKTQLKEKRKVERTTTTTGVREIQAEGEEGGPTCKSSSGLASPRTQKRKAGI